MTKCHLHTLCVSRLLSTKLKIFGKSLLRISTSQLFLTKIMTFDPTKTLLMLYIYIYIYACLRASTRHVVKQPDSYVCGAFMDYWVMRVSCLGRIREADNIGGLKAGSANTGALVPACWLVNTFGGLKKTNT